MNPAQMMEAESFHSSDGMDMDNNIKKKTGQTTGSICADCGKEDLYEQAVQSLEQGVNSDATVELSISPGEIPIEESKSSLLKRRFNRKLPSRKAAPTRGSLVESLCVDEELKIVSSKGGNPKKRTKRAESSTPQRARVVDGSEGSNKASFKNVKVEKSPPKKQSNAICSSKNTDTVADSSGDFPMAEKKRGDKEAIGSTPKQIHEKQADGEEQIEIPPEAAKSHAYAAAAAGLIKLTKTRSNRQRTPKSTNVSPETTRNVTDSDSSSTQSPEVISSIINSDQIELKNPEPRKSTRQNKFVSETELLRISYTAREAKSSNEEKSSRRGSAPNESTLSACTNLISGLGDTNSNEYVEEAAWREFNPPDPNEKGFSFFPPVASNELLPLKPAPCLTNLPDTGKWSFDHESRVLLCKFQNSAVDIAAEDRTFLLQMMERDDITVVSEGLADHLNQEFWNMSTLEDRVGNEYYYSIRKFKRTVKKVKITSTGKMRDRHPKLLRQPSKKEPQEDPISGFDGNHYSCHICGYGGDIVCCDGCPKVYHHTCVPKGSSKRSLDNDDDPWHCPLCLDQELGVPDKMKNYGLNNKQPQHEGKAEKASSDSAHQYIVTHEEVDGNLSMQVKDYVRYLEQRRTALNRICQSRQKLGLDPINPSSLTDKDGRATVDSDDSDEDNFEHFEYQDVETKFHKLNVVDDVLYLYDFDMDKLMPALCDDFTKQFKLPEFLPGGAHCMMNAVNPSGRPFMGPNLYMTPPAAFTHFHQDGHGTVDSGHQCLSGYNEIIILRRLTERHKRHALQLLNGEVKRGKKIKYDGLYGLPHGDGYGGRPEWPSIDAIRACKDMNYYPSVLILKPGQFIHINKGRLHAFRKLSPTALPEDDCHAELRSNLIRTENLGLEEQLCISVAWDWMYQGVTAEGTNREIVSILECTNINRKHQKQSLAIPETCILLMAQDLLKRPISSYDHTTMLPFLKQPEPSLSDDKLSRLRGILPSLQHVVGLHEQAINCIEAKMETKTYDQELQIMKVPNSSQNPHLCTVDPYGNDFFCKLCSAELSNVYLHCVGCELLLNKDFNICMCCYHEKQHKQQIQMHPLDNRRHSTTNHTGNFHFERSTRCPCKRGPSCKNCGFCAGCSCKCHTWFTVQYRFKTIDDEKKLVKCVEDKVSSQPIRFLDETRARLKYISTANVYDDTNTFHTVQAKSNVQQASARVEDSKESLIAIMVGSSVKYKVSIVIQDDEEQSIDNDDQL